MIFLKVRVPKSEVFLSQLYGSIDLWSLDKLFLQKFLQVTRAYSVVWGVIRKVITCTIEPNRDLLGLKFIHTEICAVEVFNRKRLRTYTVLTEVSRGF